MKCCCCENTLYNLNFYAIFNTGREEIIFFHRSNFSLREIKLAVYNVFTNLLKSMKKITDKIAEKRNELLWGVIRAMSELYLRGHWHLCLHVLQAQTWQSMVRSFIKFSCREGGKSKD